MMWGQPVAKTDAETRKDWESHPGKHFDLIIRVKGNVTERLSELEDAGVSVERRFRLTHSLGIRCKGRQALALLDLPWVIRVEPDRPVRAFGR